MTADPAGRPRPPQTRRLLARATVSMEALLIVFAVLVAKDLSGLAPGAVIGFGVVLAAVCLLVAGALPSRWGYLAGSVLQLGLVAAGLVVPVMWFLGPVFAGLWIAALYFGAKAERISAARLGGPDSAAERSPGPGGGAQ